jgi:hypothetical protein
LNSQNARKFAVGVVAPIQASGAHMHPRPEPRRAPRVLPSILASDSTVGFLNDKRHRVDKPAVMELLSDNQISFKSSHFEFQIHIGKLRRWTRGRDPEHYAMLQHAEHEINFLVRDILKFLNAFKN